MLEALRKHATGWVAQIFIVLLVLSFGVWGIADIFTGFRAGTVARVGGTDISIVDFQNLYTRQLQAVSRQIGRPVTPDQARTIGLPGEVLRVMMNDAAINDQARRMQLGISDDKLVSSIASDPNFQSGGRFNRGMFQMALQQMGLTEDRFVQLRRRDEIREQVTEALVGGLSVPEVYGKAIHTYSTEARSIRFVILPADAVAEPPAPTDEALTAYFDANKARWSAPEFRAVTVMTLQPGDIARPEDVTDDEARAEYDRHRDSYGTPERRKVQQIVFKNEDEAKAAADRLASGTTFDAIATERGLATADTELGVVARSGIADPAIAEAAFGLASGATSGVVKGRFGPVIVRVSEIQPGDIKSFEDVKAEIKADIARQRASEQVLDEHDKIEDARAGGESIAEIAKRLELPLKTVPAVDRRGLGPDDAQVEMPAKDVLLPQIFESDVGIENDPITTAERGFAWFEVTGVTPARERPLTEIRDKVVASWRAEEIAKTIAREADALAERVRAGATLDTIAGEKQLKVETADGLTRIAPPTAPVTPTMVIAAFAGPAGLVTVADAPNGGKAIIEVTRTEEPAFDAADAIQSETRRQLSGTIGQELVDQYVNELRESLGYSINQAAVQLVIGNGTGG